MNANTLQVKDKEFQRLSKRFGTITQRIENLKASQKSLGKDLLTLKMDYFLQKYPYIDSIEWTQYTPYWNDGNETHFSVNEPQLEFPEPIADNLLETCLQEITQFFYDYIDVFESIAFNEDKIFTYSRMGLQTEDYTAHD